MQPEQRTQIDGAPVGSGTEMRFRDALHRAWQHYASWRGRISAVSALASIAALSEAGVVVLVADLATLALQGADDAVVDSSGLLLGLEPEAMLAAGVALVLIRALADLLAGWLQAELVSSYDAAQRLRVIYTFEHASWPVQSEARRGELVELAGTYLTQTRVAIKAFTDVIVSFLGFAILLIGGIVAGGAKAVAIVVVFGVVGLMLLPTARWTRRSAHQVAAATPRFANRMTEAVDLAREVKSFAVAEGSIGRVRRAVDSLREAWKGFYFSQAVGPMVVQSALLLVTVIGLGIIVLADVSDAASYVAMILLLYRAAQYGRSLQGASQVLVVASPFRERLDIAVERLDANREQTVEGFMPALQTLSAHDVSFAYPGHAPVLTGVTFEVSAGEVLGIVGASGVGKTTLLNLLLRLESPTVGELRLNGIAASTIGLSSWRRAIGFVPQDAVLLDATVDENVRFFRDLDAAVTIDALRAANVLDEMRALPGGLDFQVGERGMRLSGGQRQRLCLARALAAGPTMLVLDEPTSALDPESEIAFRRTLEDLRGRVTTVIAAHRRETIAVCDRVLRVEGGQLIGTSPARP